MRRTTTLLATLTLLVAPLAHADWLVRLDSGKQLAIDSYWEENGTLHLEKDGVTFTVPRTRIASMKKAEPTPAPVDARMLAPATAPAPEAEADGTEAAADQQLLKRDEKVSWRLIQRQMDRLFAEANGADAAELKRVEARFRKAQGKFVAVQRQLRRVPAQAAPTTVASAAGAPSTATDEGGAADEGAAGAAGTEAN